MSDAASEFGLLRTSGEPPVAQPPVQAGRELFVRHARKDGRSIAVLRAVDLGSACVVETEVYPAGAFGSEPARPGPYTFATAQEATAFVTEAVEALMYLGCDITAS